MGSALERVDVLKRLLGLSTLVAAGLTLIACSPENGLNGMARQTAAPKVTSSQQVCALPLSGWVVDQADVLGVAFEADLTSRLSALEKATSDQFMVVSTKSLEGQSIEAYSLELANCWGLGGYRDVNNGLLILIAPNERKARIEVGLGLESVVTNSEAEVIMKSALIPSFAKANFEQGVADGAELLVKELKQNSAQVAQRLSANRRGGNK